MNVSACSGYGLAGREPRGLPVGIVRLSPDVVAQSLPDEFEHARRLLGTAAEGLGSEAARDLPL